MNRTSSSPEPLYHRLATLLEGQITSEVLKIGDKLPSVRAFSQQQGVSISTALQAYYLLEARGLIEARPQSGYYVRYAPARFPELPGKSAPSRSPVEADAQALIDEVFGGPLADPGNLVPFSLSVPAPELLPVAKLNKSLVEAARTLPASGTQYERVQGNLELRRQIARLSINWGGALTENDVVTTAGCMDALSYALIALTEPGDTVAVESPTYFGVLQLARSLGLRVLELPTHPATGVDLNALEHALRRQPIRACLFTPNFSNPLGSCMPDAHKQALVKLLADFGTYLVEDDLYGDVYFGEHRPKNAKTYDESGMVLWCGSVSKTLAPGYRVGWIAPGRYLEKIKRLKLYHSVSSPTLPQAAVGMFMAGGGYERHLRRLRRLLQTNCLQYIRAVHSYFPPGTRLCRPTGGFALWMELDARVDTHELYRRALKRGISIAPGRMFTLQEQYRHCLRVSYGLPWGERVENALRTLGKLVNDMVEMENGRYLEG